LLKWDFYLPKCHPVTQPNHEKGAARKMKKKRSEETQTLRAGCSKTEPKISPCRRPSSRGRAGRPKFNQLEMVTIFTCKVQTQFGEDRWTQFRVIMVTDPQTNSQTDRGDYNTLRRSFASAQCNKIKRRECYYVFRPAVQMLVGE